MQPHRRSSANACSSKSQNSPGAPPGSPPLVELGYVARAHGVRGAVLVRLHHPGSDSLRHLDAVMVRRRGADAAEEMALAEARPLPNGGWLVRIEGISTRTAADALRGAVLSVPRDRLLQPEPGEYFVQDLLHLEVLDPDGRPRGRVTRIYDNGAQAVLVVDSPELGEVDVPFVEEHVGEVDLERRTLVVRDLDLLVPEK